MTNNIKMNYKIKYNSEQANLKSENQQREKNFGDVLKLQDLNHQKNDPKTDALKKFYEIYQKSQITGVAKTEFDLAISALGLNPENDQIEAIKMLQENGFETGAPTLGAIIKYGTQASEYGNQSYLVQKINEKLHDNKTDINNIGFLKQIEVESNNHEKIEIFKESNLEQVEKDIEVLNKKYDKVLGKSKNYHEAVSYLSKDIDLTPYLDMTLTQALPMIISHLKSNQSKMITEEWLKIK